MGYRSLYLVAALVILVLLIESFSAADSELLTFPSSLSCMFFAWVSVWCARAFGKMHARIEDLEARLEAVTPRPTMK